MKKNKNIIGHAKSIFPNCKDTTLLVVKEQERSLYMTEKIRLYFHLMICSFCRLFRTQSNMIHTQIHELVLKNKIVFKLTEEQKHSMKIILGKNP